jgi:hypothetical protein
VTVATGTATTCPGSAVLGNVVFFTARPGRLRNPGSTRGLPPAALGHIGDQQAYDIDAASALQNITTTSRAA